MSGDRFAARGLWFFDCDGVLLNSNAAKSQAFHTVTLQYGDAVADAVLSHHLQHGGVSRFVKLERIFTDLLQRPAAPGEYEDLLASFAAESRRALAAVGPDESAANVFSLLRKRQTSLHVVSGGQEDEVQWALAHHRLADRFDGVHGSPRTKTDIITAILDDTEATPERAVLVGDSRLDMEVAAEHGLQRVFVSHWTEFADWEEYVAHHPQVLVVADLGELHRVLIGEQDLDPTRDLAWVASHK